MKNSGNIPGSIDDVANWFVNGYLLMWPFIHGAKDGCNSEPPGIMVKEIFRRSGFNQLTVVLDSRDRHSGYTSALRSPANRNISSIAITAAR